MQVLETLFIGYTTVAAIFYSKANPITSYYDYTEYLGDYANGRRDIENVDDDTVDVDVGDGPEPTTSWISRTENVLRCVLDAIEKGKRLNERIKT